MESGFEQDPEFTIIWMPEHEDKGNDGTSTTEANSHVADSAAEHRVNHDRNSDRAN